MSWRHRTVSRLVLLVAWLLVDDPELRKELRAISLNIQVEGKAA